MLVKSVDILNKAIGDELIVIQFIERSNSVSAKPADRSE